MKRLRISFITCMMLLAVLFTAGLSSCNSDKISQESYYTFTGDMLGEYLAKNPDEYSEFSKLLDTTKVMGLLDAYGEYTCFAPSNEAMFNFYHSLGRNSIEEFPYDSIVKIVYDHIINGYVVTTDDFVEGRLSQKSMSDRYFSVSYGSFSSGDLTIRVNTSSPILEPNIEVHNGVIHKIGEVLRPSEKLIIEAIADDPKFTMFYNALINTKLFEKLMLVEDETYNPSLGEYKFQQNNGNDEIFPPHRKYGYTALMESDSTFIANGLTSLDAIKAYAKEVYDKVYPEDAGITDITNPKNSFNRFIAYHLINKNLSKKKFVEDYFNTGHQIKSYDMYEYIEMMAPHTLLEARTNVSTNEYTLLNTLNDDPATAVRIVETNYDNDALNGVYHEIDKILTYNFDVASMLSSKRLRMDVASFFPEIANNNMRAPGKIIPFIIPYNYFDRLEFSEGTILSYLNADGRYEDYQGDELFSRECLYDFTITTPSVPAGTYEVRFSWQPTAWRGAAQLYFDGIPCGIPLDLSLDANDPAIGHEVPGSVPSDPYGYENDKLMRNRGYMKGAASYSAVDHVWYPAANARASVKSARKILGIYTFPEPSEHTFHVKAARAGQFMMDFLEFVPVEVLEYEGID
ncbi:fasciclin domain-containing protein [Saccharicrinis sp. FJH54]|uniref:fasciclin domain-containing protein n=1 Tax=Saccharicrinis sp. FJH54 TaxID=3344665 RepID=UPI0035D48B9E